MKKIILVTFILLLPLTAIASEIGRYQAVSLPKEQGTSAPNEVLIIDTKEGHIWKWSEYSTIQNIRNGERSLIYMGRTKAGKKMGDIIERQKFKDINDGE